MSQDSSITDAINKTPVLTVFQPASTVGVARFGQWLASEGAILNTIDLGADQPVPAYSELNSDGIIILGGPMGANDGADYPWIEPLSQLVREAYAHAMPVFGICLGSQLSARALGGQVASPAPGQGESGLASVFLTEAGQEDEAIAEMFAQGDAASARADVATNEGTQLPVPVNHNDAVVALPPQAKLLASSKDCPIEAWRLGSVLGLQWHPEVVPERLYLWAKENGAQAGLDEAEIKRQADDVPAQGRRIDAITCAMGRTAARMLLRKARAYRVLQSVVD